MKRAALTLAVGNGASKLLGLAREVCFAAWFGTTEVAAAFRIAQSLVFISIHSLVGDTMAGGMLPLYQKLRVESEEKARALLAIVLMQGMVIGAAISLCMFFLSAQIVNILAPGASAAAKTLAAGMVQIMAVVAPVYIIGNTLAYIESAHGKYTTLSSRTSLANVGIICAGAVAAYLHQPAALAIGFVLVYAVFLAATITDFFHSGLSRFILGAIAKPLHPIFWRFERNTISLIGIFLIAQMNVVGERIVASWLGTAVIPGLDYARFLTDTLTVLLAVPIGIVTMASHGASSAMVLREHSRKASELLFVITIPLSVFIHVSATDIVHVIYARGAFDQHSVQITAGILRGAAIGVFATVTSYLLIKSLNTALRNVETALLTLLAAAVNTTFNLLCWRILGPTALGLGNALYGIVLLLGTITLTRLWRPLAGMLLPSLLMAIVLVLLLAMLPVAHFALVNLSLKFLVVGAAWGAYCLVAPRMRRAVAPAVMKLGFFKR